MSADSATAAFAESCERVDVELTCVPAEEALGAVTEALESPAVGVPLGIDDIDLATLEAVTVDPTPAEIEAAETGVTAAGLGIAEYGSIVIEGTPVGEEPTSLFVERHVAVLPASELVQDMSAAVERMAERATEGTEMVIATGPSATADMGALVKGAHGPETVHVVLVEDR